ncbi:putative glycoside hydrolase family 15 protein [Actinomyces ruminis]|uniref:putative glycoside hydrolase family 15 protein n=1 Tax=Actinomyces ruminis TaxID=1937003 RepID=UPI00211F2CE8|nr:putative glycoside hydrolase family 15 protein [Actinomyces ruminis]
MTGTRPGVGAWLRYGEPLAPAEVDFAIAHYRTAVLQPWETVAAARLKDAAPDMTVLAYRCLSSVRIFEPPERRASGIGWSEARNRGWIARRAGEPVEWSSYPGHFQARVWDPAYRAAWTERVTASLDGTAFDGVMADNDVFEDYYGLGLPAIAVGDPDAPVDVAGLRKALGELVEAAGRALTEAGRLLVPNIAEARREPGRWRQHAAWGGGFEECWLGWGDDAMFDATTAAAQTEQLGGPGLGLLRTPSGGRGRVWDGSQQGLYGLALFWIVAPVLRSCPMRPPATTTIRARPGSRPWTPISGVRADPCTSRAGCGGGASRAALRRQSSTGRRVARSLCPRARCVRGRRAGPTASHCPGGCGCVPMRALSLWSPNLARSVEVTCRDR